jgi:hypothetical protein
LKNNREKIQSLFLDIQTTKGMQSSSFRQLVENTLAEVRKLPDVLEHEEVQNVTKWFVESLHFIVADLKSKTSNFIRTNNSLELILSSNRRELKSEKNMFKSLLHSEHSTLNSIIEEFEKRFDNEIKENIGISDNDRKGVVSALKNLMKDLVRSNSRLERTL